MTNNQNQVITTVMSGLMLAAVLWVGSTLTANQVTLAEVQKEIMHLRGELNQAVASSGRRDLQLADMDRRVSALEAHHD